MHAPEEREEASEAAGIYRKKRKTNTKKTVDNKDIRSFFDLRRNDNCDKTSRKSSSPDVIEID